MNHSTDKQKQEARELLPCPFCGGVAILGMFNVWCSKCRAATDKDVDASADGIIRCWNKRILSSRDAEIKQVLEGLRGQFGAVNCWCDVVEDDTPHLPACLATRTLWDKTQGENL